MGVKFLKLTRPAIRRLAHGGTLTEHGITFTRRADGEGVYSVNVMVNGQRIHRVIGRDSDGTTRTQAEDFIERVRADAKRDRLGLPQARARSMLLRHAANAYVKKLEAEGGKDLKMKRMRLHKHLVPFLGRLPLAKISGSDIERYKAHRAQQESQRG